MNPRSCIEKLASSAIMSAWFLAGCAGGLQEDSQARLRPDELPTLEVAHQRSGPALPQLPPSSESQHLTYRVCVGTGKGKAVEVQPVFGAAPADAVLLPVLRESEWELGAGSPNQSTAGLRCFLDSLESGTDGTLRSAAQPFLTATSERVSQPGDISPQLPESVQQKFVGKSVVGMYRMCLSAGSGDVTTVKPVVGIPGADTEVTAALRSWKYKPMPAESCWIEPLMFTLAGGPAAPAQPTDGNTDYNRDVSKMPRKAMQ